MPIQEDTHEPMDTRITNYGIESLQKIRYNSSED